MTVSIDYLRNQAKKLKSAFDEGDKSAQFRVCRRLRRENRNDLGEIKHADCLHVIARENGFESWPKLKAIAELGKLDKVSRQKRLAIALYSGRLWVVEHLLGEDPDLADGDFALQVGLYDLEGVQESLLRDPGLATQKFGAMQAIGHLSTSQHIRFHPELEDKMLAMAELLVEHGADVNEHLFVQSSSEIYITPLYGAVVAARGGNLALVKWLLDNGADPNDGEALYISCYVKNIEVVELLLSYGAKPAGTNALSMALRENKADIAKLLLDAGAGIGDYDLNAHINMTNSWVLPPLFEASRQMCGAAMISALLDAGMDGDLYHREVSAYAFAAVLGNQAMVDALNARGLGSGLSEGETLLAHIAQEGLASEEQIDVSNLPSIYQEMIILVLQSNKPSEDKLLHIKRLVAAGLDCDKADDNDMTALHHAIREGYPDIVAYLISIGADLEKTDRLGKGMLEQIGFGGARGEKAIACARMLLDAGLPLPRDMLNLKFEPYSSYDPKVSEFLQDWADRHPDRVV